MTEITEIHTLRRGTEFQVSYVKRLVEVPGLYVCSRCKMHETEVKLKMHSITRVHDNKAIDLSSSLGRYVTRKLIERIESDIYEADRETQGKRTCHCRDGGFQRANPCASYVPTHGQETDQELCWRH